MARDILQFEISHILMLCILPTGTINSNNHAPLKQHKERVRQQIRTRKRRGDSHILTVSCARAGQTRAVVRVAASKIINGH